MISLSCQYLNSTATVKEDRHCVMNTFEVAGVPQASEIQMVEPRSSFSSAGISILVCAGVAATFLILRFLAIGAWPISIFAALGFGILSLSLYIFRKSHVHEERLRIRGGELEFIRSDRRGKLTRIVLPAFWTRLEIKSRSDIECDLWLVFRNQRHPVGRCVSADERRRLAPHIRTVLFR